MSMLGDNLRISRERAGLSRRQAADYIQRTPPAISKYETGKADPSIATLCKLCKLYHCTPNELLGYEQRRTTRNGSPDKQTLEYLKSLGFSISCYEKQGETFITMSDIDGNTIFSTSDNITLDALYRAISSARRMIAGIDRTLAKELIVSQVKAFCYDLKIIDELLS